MAKGLGGTVTEIEINGVYYRVHTFLSDDNFQVTFPGDFEYLLVAGGGAGGVGGGTAGAGGGGAGGLLRSTVTLGLGLFPLTVGLGGLANQNDLAGEDGLPGGNSTFAGATATGGGGGAGSAGTNGNNGGSGGGARGFITSNGGLGTIGQGNAGGNNTLTGSGTAGAGGGGAGSAGGNATVSAGGSGGSGYNAADFGLGFIAGGGGGGAGNLTTFGSATAGGGENGADAIDNTGGGGAGGNSDGTGSRAAGDGGSGIVSIRYEIPPPGLRTVLGMNADKSTVVEGDSILFQIQTENFNDGETIPYFISGDVNQDDIDIPLIGNFTVTNNIAELTVSTLRNDRTENTENLVLNIDGFSVSVDIFNFNPEFVILTETNSLLYTSNDFFKIVDLSKNLSNLVFIRILSLDELNRMIRGIEESVIEGGKIFYSTDFVSITNFNVPEPEPLVFPERWAG